MSSPEDHHVTDPGDDDWIFFPEITGGRDDDSRTALDELHDSTPAWLHDEPKPYSEAKPREYDNPDRIPEFEEVLKRDGKQVWNRQPKPHGEEPDVVVDTRVVSTREEVR